jgi:hypothetical protein
MKSVLAGDKLVVSITKIEAAQAVILSAQPLVD